MNLSKVLALIKAYGGGVQSDLSVKDESDQAFVKGVIRQESLPDGYPYRQIELIKRLSEVTYAFYNVYNNGFASTNGLAGQSIFSATWIKNRKHRVVWDGVEYELDTQNTGNAYIYDSGNENTGEPFYIVVGSKGVHYIYALEQGTHTFEIYEYIEEIQVCDDEFIPNYFAKLTSAEIGQTIIVKSVDESGFPIEWEAVNMPKAISVADAAGETPTAAEFNALLAALRDGGIISTE